MTYLPEKKSEIITVADDTEKNKDNKDKKSDDDDDSDDEDGFAINLFD